MVKPEVIYPSVLEQTGHRGSLSMNERNSGYSSLLRPFRHESQRAETGEHHRVNLGLGNWTKRARTERKVSGKTPEISSAVCQARKQEINGGAAHVVVVHATHIRESARSSIGQ